MLPHQKEKPIEYCKTKKKRVLKNPVSTHASFFVLPNSWLEWFTNSTITLIDLLVQGYVHAPADDLSRRHRWNWHGAVWCQKGRKETHLCGQNASHGESVEQRLVCCCSQWQKHSWQTWRWRCWEYVWSSSGSTPVFAARNGSCCGWVAGFQKVLLPKWKKSIWKACHTWQKFLLPPWNFRKDLCLVLKPKPCRSTQSVDTVLWKKPNVVSL